MMFGSIFGADFNNNKPFPNNNINKNISNLKSSNAKAGGYDFDNHDILNDLYLRIASDTKRELLFVQDVYKGNQQIREDVRKKYINHLADVIGVVSDHVPFASIITSIMHACGNYLESNNESSHNKFIEQWKTSQNHNIQEISCNQLAREIIYRYGHSFLHYISLIDVYYTTTNNSSNHNKIIMQISQITAIRIIFYAMNHNLPLIDCEQIVDGLPEAFQGYPQQIHLSNFFAGGIKNFTISNLYENSGYLTPNNNYWIHKDFIRQNKIQNKSFVSFINPIKSKNMNLIVSTNHLIPIYGYIRLPHDIYPIYTLNYTKQIPDAKNQQILSQYQLQYIYIDITDIKNYLKAIINTNIDITNQKNKVISFNQWLIKAKNNNFYKELYPIFRGLIDNNDLLAENLDFSLGIFDNIDFSYTIFQNLTINSMKFSTLIKCKFINCTNNNNNQNNNNYSYIFQYSDLSFSEIYNCIFYSLKCSFKILYGIINNTKFLNCEFISFQIDGTNIDDISREYFGNSNNVFDDPITNNKENVQIFITETEILKKYEKQLHNYIQTTINNQFINNLPVAPERLTVPTAPAYAAESETYATETTNESNDNTIPIVQAKLFTSTERYSAYNINTLPDSINQLEKSSNNSNNNNNMDTILSQIFDILFFNKPVSLLRKLPTNPIKWYTIQRVYSYTTSGQIGQVGINGDNGTNGVNGGGAGSDGTSGQNGQSGSSAYTNTISLLSVPNQDIFIISPKEFNQEAVLMPLNDPNVQINLYALGGRGGNGGSGGKGGNGGKGIDGADATKSRSGTSGNLS